MQELATGIDECIGVVSEVAKKFSGLQWKIKRALRPMVMVDGQRANGTLFRLGEAEEVLLSYGRN